MKKTFRFVCLMLALVLLLSFTACGGTVGTSDASSGAATTTTKPESDMPDPIEMYKQAERLMDAQENWKQTVSTTMRFEINGTALEMEAGGYVIKRGFGEAMQYASVATVNLFGNEYASEVYFKDGTCYTQEQGVYDAQEMTAADFEKDILNEASSDDIDPEDFENVVLTEEDGKYVLNVDITGESAKRFDTMFQGMEATVVLTSIPTTIVFRADGTLDSITFEVTANGVLSEQAAVVTVKATTLYSASDDTITIDWPDLNFYKEGYAVTDRRLEIVDKVKENLFDENGNYVANAQELYSLLCTMYGDFDTAWALDYILLEGDNLDRDQYVVVYMTRYALWDVDGNPVEDIEAQYEALCTQYGQSAVDAAVSYITGE